MGKSAACTEDAVTQLRGSEGVGDWLDHEADEKICRICRTYMVYTRLTSSYTVYQHQSAGDPIFVIPVQANSRATNKKLSRPHTSI